MAFIMPVLLLSQNPNANEVRDIVESATSLFKEKKYEESITESDRGLVLCGNHKDSLYIVLLANKALCYHRLKNTNIAIPMLKEAIISYQSKGKKDQLLSHICRHYCNIASVSSDKQFYQNCIHEIFRTKHLHKNDYKIYKEYFFETYGELDFELLSKALEREEYEMKGCFDNFYTHFFEYLKGYVFSLKPSGRVTWDRTKDEKIKAIPFFENAIKGLKPLDTLLSKEFVIESYSCLADIYESLGQNALAAIMHREVLSLVSDCWKDLNYKSPWSLRPNSANHIMARFESYTEQLAITRQYRTIVDYCNMVLDDKRLKEAGDNCYIFVLEKLKEAYQQLNNFDEVERIDKILSSIKLKTQDTSSNLEISSDDAIKLFKERKLTANGIEKIAHSISWRGTDFADLYDLLISQNDYNTIFLIGNRVLEERKAKESGGLYLSKEDVIAKKCTQYDYEIDGEREFWHHANGSKALWHTYYYLALAHLNSGNYKEAIKFQQRVIDNVRTDWKYEPAERERILKEDFSYSNWVVEYPDVEIEMFLQMAYIYLVTKDYANSYAYYKKALDLNLQVLETVLKSGSQIIKEKEWDNRNYVYYTVLDNLTDVVATYPRFGNMILEATVMQKGFLLNLYLRTKDAVSNSNFQVKNANKEKNNAEKLIERACYDHNVDMQEAIIKSQNADIIINNTIGIDKIIQQTNESISDVKDRLHTADVLVDFFTLYRGEDIEKEKQIINDSIVICRSYSDLHIYATILRKGWQYPKVVYLGKISDAINDNYGKDLIDYVYYNNDESSEINKLYKSTAFTYFVWDKIVSEGRIQKGENIHFIPSGLFNRIAIEYLPLNDNQLVSDKYHIFRLSSIRELYHIQPVYSQNDKCVAFGDIINYASNHDITLTDAQQCAAKTMAANPKAILDRSQLKGLSSTRSVIETISQVVNNTKLVTGAYANEKAFYELDGDSPEILFLGTHGYNFEKKELGEKESTYLFGDRRNVYLSESEKGMYTSGLYLAPSNTQDINTDGMLTAKEISMCDLSGTKLAVLSACSTAIGVSSQDGIYGLQRGFKMAGVQSIVASLWEVHEKTTQDLMTEFFKQYTNGKNIYEALRLAQQHVREYVDESDDDNAIIRAGQGKIYSNPYYWAGFILID